MKSFSYYKLIFVVFSLCLFYFYSSVRTQKESKTIYSSKTKRSFDNKKSSNLKKLNYEDNYVNVYSSVNKNFLEDLFKLFTKNTGIEVKIFTGDSDFLISMLEDQGSFTDIDVLILPDFLSLEKAKDKNLFKVPESVKLFKNIPVEFRDIDNKWFGLGYELILIAYAKNKYNEENFLTYDSLSEDIFKADILSNLETRLHKNILFKTFLSYLVSVNGIEATSDFMLKLSSNYSVKVFKKAKESFDYIEKEGTGVFLTSSTDYINFIEEEKNKNITLDNLGIGVAVDSFINLSGAGLLFSSKHKSNGTLLLEFLSTAEAQEIYALKTKKYPVNISAKIPESLSLISVKRILKRSFYDVFRYLEDIEKLY